MYVVGVLTDLEYSLRATAAATEKVDVRRCEREPSSAHEKEAARRSKS